MFWYASGDNNVNVVTLLTTCSPMTPLMTDSIIRPAEGSWLLGNTMVCEVVTDVPDDSIKSWQDDDGLKYCLRAIPEDEGASIRSKTDKGLDAGLFHETGTANAVWLIGGLFFKVKGWLPGMQSEANTIPFAHGMFPLTPDVIHSWIDVSWNRSYLVTKRVQGKTLKHAWEAMSPDSRHLLASTVALICKNLADATSGRLEALDGGGVFEPFLRASPPKSEPSWKPQLLGPYTVEDLQAYVSGLPEIADMKDFYFYHADLDPTNIMVDDDGNLTGIIDWESAAFYPRFWITTKPLVCGFTLELAEGEERQAWTRLLSQALERVGFASNVELYRRWRTAVGED